MVLVILGMLFIGLGYSNQGDEYSNIDSTSLINDSEVLENKIDIKVKTEDDVLRNSVAIQKRNKVNEVDVGVKRLTEGINYDSEGKMVIESNDEAKNIDIRSYSNWEYEDFERVLPNEMLDLIPTVLKIEKEVGINAVYLMAVAINETGWGKHMSGRYNYFNWSRDGIKYFDFDSLEDFTEHSLNLYKKWYINPEFYKDKLGHLPDKITIEVVNVRYALNRDGSTNWVWSKTVSQVMRMLSERRV